MNGAAPAVAIISTGSGQSWSFQLPRKAVIEKVLAATVACVDVPAALVLQTEEGAPAGPKTSRRGFCVGNIVVKTNGSVFTVDADGEVTEGPNEVNAAHLPQTFDVDDDVDQD